MNFWKRVSAVLYSDMTALVWTLGWISQALAFGFFVSGTNTKNYDLLNSIVPKEIWGILFSIYGFILLARCLYKIPTFLVYLNSITGVWLWTYLFFSFAIFDPTPIASTEWMLLLPIVTQLWIFFNSTLLKNTKPAIDKQEHQSENISELISLVKNEIHYLNEELVALSKENRTLKDEVNTLTSEVHRIKYSLCGQSTNK